MTSKLGLVNRPECLELRKAGRGGVYVTVLNKLESTKNTRLTIDKKPAYRLSEKSYWQDVTLLNCEKRKKQKVEMILNKVVVCFESLLFSLV